MKYLPSMFLIILLLMPTLINNSTLAQESTLEVELAIIDERDDFLVDFGVEETIDLRFVQNGFNWTKLSEGGFFFSKIYLPIMFYSLRFLLGYNSVIFNASVVGNPRGWQAWVSPNSVTYFTGESQADLKLHIKVSRPTDINTATIRVNFQAYGGNNAPIGESSTDILVSVKQYHIAQITALEQSKEVRPDTITTFPIEVTNLGNYQDTYGFTITNETNGFLGVVSGFLTLEPGETGQISAVVSSPYTYFYDFGSKTSLNISAYSIYDSSKQFNTMVQITSRGVQFSQPFIYTVVLTILILLVLFFLYKYLIDKKEIEVYGKPIKPWKIPIEKQYLLKIKKEDPEKYQKIMKMMNDEYQSALFWFKDYRSSVKEDKNIIKDAIDSIGGFFKQSQKTVQGVKKESSSMEESKSEKVHQKIEPSEKQTESDNNIFKKLDYKLFKNKIHSVFSQKDKNENEKVEDVVKKESSVTFQEVTTDEPESIDKDEIEKQLRDKTIERIKRKQNKQRKKLGN